MNFQLRFEFFNFFNRANLNTVDTNLPDGNFGQATEPKCAAIPSDRRKYNFLDAYPGQMRSRLNPDFSANHAAFTDHRLCRAFFLTRVLLRMTSSHCRHQERIEPPKRDAAGLGAHLLSCSLFFSHSLRSWVWAREARTRLCRRFVRRIIPLRYPPRMLCWRNAPGRLPHPCHARDGAARRRPSRRRSAILSGGAQCLPALCSGPGRRGPDRVRHALTRCCAGPGTN